MATQATSRPQSGSDPAALADRWLFALGTEPVLIIEAATGQVLESNLAASVLLNVPCSALVGAPFPTLFGPAGAAVLEHAMVLARSSGIAGPLILAVPNSGLTLSMTLSLVRQESVTFWIARLASLPAGRAAAVQTPNSALVLAAIEGAAEGFVVTDTGLKVELANEAFLDMTRLASNEEMYGHSIVHWLEFTVVELAQLHAQMRDREAVTVLNTHLRCTPGSTIPVEVHAVAVPDGEHPCWGFVIRPLHASMRQRADLLPVDPPRSDH